jgi:transcriptional regulator with XRE-family HTH domain
MRRTTEPEELRLALLVLRGLRGWTQVELAKAAGTTPSVLSEYESGKRRLTPKAMKRMTAAAGVPPAFLEALLPALSSLVAAQEVPHPAACTPFQAHSVTERVRNQLDLLLRRVTRLVTFQPEPKPDPPTPEDRESARYLWARLERYAMPYRQLLVEHGAEFRSWALSERICEESVKAAETSANAALELARLALRVADLIPGEKAWRCRVQGYAWAHLGYARMVRGEISEAEKAFDRSERLWQAGAAADPGLLTQPPFLDYGAHQGAPPRISPAAAERPRGAEKK